MERLVLFFFYTFVFMRLVIKQCLRAKFSSRHRHSPNVCENWQSPELSDIKPMSVLHLFEVPPYAIFLLVCLWQVLTMQPSVSWNSLWSAGTPWTSVSFLPWPQERWGHMCEPHINIAKNSCGRNTVFGFQAAIPTVVFHSLDWSLCSDNSKLLLWTYRVDYCC